MHDLQSWAFHYKNRIDSYSSNIMSCLQPSHAFFIVTALCVKGREFCKHLFVSEIVPIARLVEKLPSAPVTIAVNLGAPMLDQGYHSCLRQLPCLCPGRALAFLKLNFDRGFLSHPLVQAT